MKRKNQRQTIIMTSLLLFLFLGMGYAFLSTNLSISGASNVSKNTWNVHWDNIKVKSGSVSGEQVISAPTISNQTSVAFRVRLKEPGEYYEFTVDARNDGSLDAMISEIKTYVNNIEEGSIPSYLKVSLTCEGVNVGEKQELKANTKRTYTFKILYRDDINPSSLPSTPQSFSFKFELPYVQANNMAIPFDIVYETSSANLQIGNAIPDGVTVYDNYQDAINAFDNRQFFLKHAILNGKIASNFVGFIMNGNVYYIRGGDNGESFPSNKEVLDEAFGAKNCISMGIYYVCYSQSAQLTSIICKDGCADVHDSTHICESSENGGVYCSPCNGACLYIS